MEKGSSKDDEGDSSKVRKPRRERKEEPVADAKPQQGSPNKPEEAPVEGKPRRRRAADVDEKQAAQSGSGGGGWMTSPTPGKSAASLDDEDDENSKVNLANKDKHFQDGEEGDILTIPDLDEDGADADSRVARAPRNVTRKIPTLTDLENDVKSAVPAAEGGLDLSILLSALMPAAQLVEPDNNWTFDSLLREVTDELTGTPKTVVAVVTKEVSTTKSAAGSSLGGGSTSPSNAAPQKSKGANAPDKKPSK